MQQETGRIEAFSDGVFAIVITLLILDIHAPKGGPGHSLWHQLGVQWPHYAAYVVSFTIIGVMWVNHHHIFNHLVRVDRPLLFLNLLVLMVVSIIPWTTAVMAQNLTVSVDDGLAAAVLYSGWMVVYALSFTVFWWYVTREGHLFHAKVDPAGARGTRLRFGLGAVAYPVAFGLAFVSASLTLIAHGLIAAYYAANQLAIPLREPA
ncbi:TMEM175 family protein [Streptacidiphilus rugosus]|uniref:TMEM175 family protein n=1 Tax=Streptacidiphilus rugosus TaxID=405783 RepID=UPI00055D2874|nr:TMEM175 family protein [Streptacidiphilus rugosus]